MPAIIKHIKGQSVGAHLFYIMGSSGSGKDTLLRQFRERMADLPCLVAHRYITRKPEIAGENHIWVPEQEFEKRVMLGAFAMYWEANGEHYGIGKEIDHWLELGINVLVNGSREYFEQAQQLYGTRLVPVLLQVAPGILKQRLILRGRETPEEIEARLERDRQISGGFASKVIQINNDEQPELATDALLAIVRQFTAKTGNAAAKAG